jgi:hypothetical protein
VLKKNKISSVNNGGLLSTKLIIRGDTDMCDEKDLEMTDEIPVLFSDDIEILESRLTDIIVAMGLPETQTQAVLNLINDVLEDHHADILDTFESAIHDDETVD